MKSKKITISSAEDVLIMVDKFQLKTGRPPRFILCERSKQKTIMEWFSFTPDQINEALGYELKGIPLVDPRDIMII